MIQHRNTRLSKLQIEGCPSLYLAEESRLFMNVWAVLSLCVRSPHSVLSRFVRFYKRAAKKKASVLRQPLERLGESWYAWLELATLLASRRSQLRRHARLRGRESCSSLISEKVKKQESSCRYLTDKQTDRHTHTHTRLAILRARAIR